MSTIALQTTSKGLDDPSPIAPSHNSDQEPDIKSEKPPSSRALKSLSTHTHHQEASLASPLTQLMVPNNFTAIMAIQDLRYFIGDCLLLQDIVRLICVDKTYHDMWAAWLTTIVARLTQYNRLLANKDRLLAFSKQFCRAIDQLPEHEQHQNIIANQLLTITRLLERNHFRMWHDQWDAYGTDQEAFKTYDTISDNQRAVTKHISQHTTNNSVLRLLATSEECSYICGLYVAQNKYANASTLADIVAATVNRLHSQVYWILEIGCEWGNLFSKDTLMIAKAVLQHVNLTSNGRVFMKNGLLAAHQKTKHMPCQIDQLLDVISLAVEPSELKTLQEKDILAYIAHHPPSFDHQLAIANNPCATEQTLNAIAEWAMHPLMQWTSLSNEDKEHLARVIKALQSHKNSVAVAHALFSLHSLLQQMHSLTQETKVWLNDHRIPNLPSCVMGQHYKNIQTYYKELISIKKFIEKDLFSQYINGQFVDFVVKIKDSCSRITDNITHYKHKFHTVANALDDRSLPLSDPMVTNDQAIKQVVSQYFSETNTDHKNRLAELMISVAEQTSNINVIEHLFCSIHVQPLKFQIVKAIASNPHAPSRYLSWSANWVLKKITHQSYFHHLASTKGKQKAKQLTDIVSVIINNPAVSKIIIKRLVEGLIRFCKNNDQLNPTERGAILNLVNQITRSPQYTPMLNTILYISQYYIMGHATKPELLSTIANHFSGMTSEAITKIMDHLNSYQPGWFKAHFDQPAKALRQRLQRIKTLAELNYHINQLKNASKDRKAADEKRALLYTLSDLVSGKNRRPTSEKKMLRQTLGQHRSHIVYRPAQWLLSKLFFFTSWFKPKSLRIVEQLEANGLVK